MYQALAFSLECNIGHIFPLNNESLKHTESFKEDNMPFLKEIILTHILLMFEFVFQYMLENT